MCELSVESSTQFEENSKTASQQVKITIKIEQICRNEQCTRSTQNTQVGRKAMPVFRRFDRICD